MSNLTGLDRIGMAQGKRSFEQSFASSIPPAQLIEMGLGISVASWAEWDGLKIMRVFAASLTDANFHGEAAQVEAMIAKLEAE